MDQPGDGVRPWSLRYIVDGKGKDTGFAMLRRSLTQEQRREWRGFIDEHRMIGFTHHGPFPLLHPGYEGLQPNTTPEDGWQRWEVQLCEAWCHCFREPDKYLPPGTPRFLISGSDFVDVEYITSLVASEPEPPKRWDAVYCCLPNRFNEMQKNWSLGKACLDVLVSELGLRVLVVGPSNRVHIPLHPNIERRPTLSWHDFLFHLARARFAFLPNQLDASPRVLTEALALDVPVLVNSRILGGWKYVNENTGEFFEGEHDVAMAAWRCLDGAYHAREWLLDNFGRPNAAITLAAALRSLGGADDLSYARPADTLVPAA